MRCFSKPEVDTLVANTEPELRMVLLGKVGVGKSASGNTILGMENVFNLSADILECHVEKGKIGEQDVVVVDTPGFFHTKRSTEDLVKEIKKSISLAEPGPHVFLIVLRIGDKYTDEEKEMVEIIRSTFGKNVMDYTMVLFTFKSRLQDTDIEEFIRSNKDLHDLILQCNWGYHVFDNTNKTPEQVTALLGQINKRIKTPGGDFYTPEMLHKAEIALRKKQQDPKGEGAQAKLATLRTFAFSGIAIGCVTGYLAGGGQVTSTVGAALGGVAGGIFASVTAGLGILAKNGIENCITK
ncbi:GTPase IMAP family member 7-like [Epinephelus moara]|uniref:GTPase IMAP family member 7-like n=1 Tax=Epinephelus moara TaxID=300413 RepID=UPI00214E22F6|nr:GTPase IMAP family member 7-like [Epinephelus moara]